MAQFSKKLSIVFSVALFFILGLSNISTAQGPGIIYTPIEVTVNTPTTIFLPASVIPNQQVTLIEGPENGTVDIQSLEDLGIDPNDPDYADIEIFIIYTPNQDYIGLDSIIIEICDTVAVYCETYGIEYIVGNGGNGGNGSQIAVDDFFQVPTDTTTLLDVLFNDIGSGLTINNVSQPTFGTAVISGSQIAYTPPPGFVGTDYLIYTVCDTSLFCEDGYVVIHVESGPGGGGEVSTDTLFASFIIPPDQPFYVFVPGFFVSNQEIEIIGPPSNGTGNLIPIDSLEIIDPNDPTYFGVSEVIEYIPNTGFTGTDTMTIRIVDTVSMDTLYVVFEYIIDGSGPGFLANDDHFTIPPDTTLTLDVLANDFGSELVIVGTTTPLNGQVSISSDSLTLIYTPNPGFTGTDYFMYTVCSSTGCLDANVDITVGNASFPLEFTISTEENIPVSFSTFEITGFPATGPITVLQEPENGTLTVDGPDLIYTPDTGFTGNDTLLVNVCYAELGLCVDLTLIIEVFPAGASFMVMNDAFQVSQDVPTVLPVLNNDMGIGLAIASVGSPQNGQAVIDSDNIVYTPNPGYLGTDVFIYTACDGNGNCEDGTVTITVVEYVISGNFTINTEQNQTATLSALDIFGFPFLDPPVILTQPANGQASSDSLNISYTPNLDFLGEDSFLVQLCLDQFSCFVFEIIVNVLPPGQTFNLEGDFISVLPGSTIVFDVLANDSGTGLTIINTTDPQNGTVDIINNQISYTPDAGFEGADQFVYTACDINGNCGNATVAIQVSDNGNLAFQTFTTPMNVPLYLPLELGIQEGIPVVITAPPVSGTLEVVQIDTTIISSGGDPVNYPNGFLLYTPAQDFTGPDAFMIYYEILPGVPELFSVLYYVDVLPTQGDCNDDCVWPGDANNNGIVDVYDLLPIGLTYGETGPPRDSATIEWIGQIAQDWSTDIPDLNINTKFADCDGNGIVEAIDTLAIVQNYNLTHGVPGLMDPLPAPQQITLVTGDPVMSAGEMVEVEIWVGSEQTPTFNMYGFAGKFIFDPEVVDAASITVEMEPGNFLSSGSEMLSLVVNHFNGQLDIAYTRTDGTSANGFGKVGTISFIVTDNIDGLVAEASSFAPVTSELKLIDTYMMDGLGQMYTLGSEPLIMTPEAGTTSVTQVNVDEPLFVAPNPADKSTIIGFDNQTAQIELINVYNSFGAQVMQINGNGQNQLELITADLIPGFYVIELLTEDGIRAVGKLQVVR